MGLFDWVKGVFGGPDDAKAKEEPPSETERNAEALMSLVDECLAGGASAEAVLALVADQAFGEGMESLEREDPAAATRVWRRLMAIAPDQPRILEPLAALYRSRREDSAAVELFERLVKLTPAGEQRARVHEQIAQLHEHNGNLGGAFEHFQLALANAVERKDLWDTCLRLVGQVGAVEELPPISVVAHTPPAGYIIRHSLGRGGFGTVYLAQDEALDRLVALKFLHPLHRQRPEQVDRFFAEARIIAQLAHPGVVNVYSIDEERALLVLEFISQGTLSDRLSAGAPLHLETALDCLVRLCDTLSFVHQRGIVHGDVKPANVLFRESGRPVLGDFGIASLGLDAVAGASRRYAAPEQLAGKPVDATADLYALGVLLLEMLTGAPPPLPEAKDEREAWLERGLTVFPAPLQETARAWWSSLLSPTPQSRPGSADLVGDVAAAFIAGLDEPSSVAGVLAVFLGRE